DGSWGPGFERMPMLRGRTDPFDMLPELRYDRMFEAIGCHAEHVTRPEEIRPALARALAAGKPSLVNVIGDPRVGHARLGGDLLGSTKVEGAVGGERSGGRRFAPRRAGRRRLGQMDGLASSRRVDPRSAPDRPRRASVTPSVPERTGTTRGARE